MLTDVRDVLFQCDPFDFDFDNNLCGFLEDQNISNSSINLLWLKDGFGKQVKEELSDKRIICSGTVIGSRSAVIQYLEAMINQLAGLKIPNIWGMDQGLHNYIIYKRLITNVRLYENNRGPVMTFSHMKEKDIHFNDKGFVINDDGSIVNILHQYDRPRLEIRNNIARYRECVAAISGEVA